MQWLLLVIAAVLALPVFFILLTIVVGWFEKLLVWPYVPIRPSRTMSTGKDGIETDQDEAPEPNSSIPITDHFRTANLTAEQTGFTFLGAFRHGKGKIYRLRFNFWISPDRLVLAQVSTGTLAGIPMSIVKLFTRLADGRCLVTLDQLRGRESDLAGLLVQEIVTGAEFLDLLDWHHHRVARASQPAIAYSRNDPLGDHRAFRYRQAERLVESGLARFIDPDRTAWRYSLRAATLIAFRPYLKQHRPILHSEGGQEIISWAEPGQNVNLPSPQRPPSSAGLLKNAELFFWIVLGVGAVSTFSRGPAMNRAQSIFRMAVSGFGLAGIAIVWLLKKRVSASRARELERSRASRSVETSMREKAEIEEGAWGEDH